MSHDRIHPLVEFLQQHVDDRAMLAELRRGLGRSPGENASLYRYVGSFIHKHHDEDTIFLIASLFALHPASTAKGNMGDHLRAYTKAVGDDAATTRRFTQLLNLHRESLNTPLRQHVALLKAQETPINWHQLAYDVIRWGHPERYIQKQWARAYWPPKSDKTKSS